MIKVTLWAFGLAAVLVWGGSAAAASCSVGSGSTTSSGNYTCVFNEDKGTWSDNRYSFDGAVYQWGSSGVDYESWGYWARADWLDDIAVARVNLKASSYKPADVSREVGSATYTGKGSGMYAAHIGSVDETGVLVGDVSLTANFTTDRLTGKLSGLRTQSKSGVSGTLATSVSMSGHLTDNGFVAQGQLDRDFYLPAGGGSRFKVSRHVVPGGSATLPNLPETNIRGDFVKNGDRAIGTINTIAPLTVDDIVTAASKDGEISMSMGFGANRAGATVMAPPGGTDTGGTDTGGTGGGTNTGGTDTGGTDTGGTGGGTNGGTNTGNTGETPGGTSPYEWPDWPITDIAAARSKTAGLPIEDMSSEEIRGRLVALGEIKTNTSLDFVEGGLIEWWIEENVSSSNVRNHDVSQFSPVMRGQGNIPMFQARTNKGSSYVRDEQIGYGGWLDYGWFIVGLNIHPDNPDPFLHRSMTDYGWADYDYPSIPWNSSERNFSWDMHWHGVMVGTDTSLSVPNFIQGYVQITVRDDARSLSDLTVLICYTMASEARGARVN